MGKLWHSGHTDDHVNPAQSTEHRPVLDNVLVCREQDLELAHADLVLQASTLSRITLIRNHLHTRCPFRELAGPIRHRRQWDYHQIRSALLLDFNEKRHERNCLDGLAETLKREKSGG